MRTTAQNPMKSLARAEITALLTLIAGVTLLAGSNALHAADAQPDTFWVPYVAATAGYEDNLLRRSDAAPIPAQFDDISSTFATLAGGLDAQAMLRKQRFTFNGELVRRRYQDIDALDHTGGHANFAWHLGLGKDWGGRISYNFTRGLRNFEFLETLVEDLRNTGRIGFSLTRQLGLRHQLELFGSHTDLRFGGPERESTDIRVDRDSLGLRYSYALSRRSKVGGVIQREQRRGVGLSEAGDFDHDSIGAFLQWSVGNKSRLDAEVHYARRDLELASGNDFDGLLGRLNFNWQTTEKTRVQALYDRRLSNLTDEIPGIALIDEVRLQPTWQATENIELGLNARYVRRDFRSVLGRIDRLYTVGASANWTLPRSITLGILVEHRNREGNDLLSDYEGTLINLSFKANLR